MFRDFLIFPRYPPEQKKKTPWPESESELYRPSNRRLSAELVPTFADRDCHVVSVTDPYGRILGFLDRSRCIFFQVPPQLHSRGWVDPVPDPLLLRKSGNAGNRTRTFGSVARNSDHWPQRRSTFFYITYINSVRTSLEAHTSPLCSQKLWPLTTEAVYFLLRNTQKFSLYLTGSTIQELWRLDHRGGLLSSTQHINSVRTSQEAQYSYISVV
jgi:hypothetical protein